MTEKLKAEVIYKEQRTQLGKMNDTLYRFPPLFATVVGGLWFLAIQNLQQYPILSAGIFFFAATCAVCSIVAMKTYRNVVVAYIDNINKLEGDLKPAVAKRHDSLETKKLHQVHTFKQLWQFLSIENFRTTFWFMLLLFIGAALSVGGVFFALSPTIKAVQVHDVAIRFVKDDSIIVCFTEMATNNSERQLIRCSDQIALPKRQ